jgi:hypothetical protein
VGGRGILKEAERESYLARPVSTIRFNDNRKELVIAPEPWCEMFDGWLSGFAREMQGRVSGAAERLQGVWRLF